MHAWPRKHTAKQSLASRSNGGISNANIAVKTPLPPMPKATGALRPCNGQLHRQARRGALGLLVWTQREQTRSGPHQATNTGERIDRIMFSPKPLQQTRDQVHQRQF
jgi:hypothetical protein